jgi:hypothetical protein
VSKYLVRQTRTFCRGRAVTRIRWISCACILRRHGIHHILGVLAFVGVCLNIVAEPTVIIELGSLGLGQAGAWVAIELELFEAANPGIVVHATSLGSEFEPPRGINNYTDIPHNVTSVKTDFGELAYLMSRGLIKDLDEFLDDPEFLIEEYPETFWDAITIDNRRYGIPFTAVSWVFVYNKRMFKNAGIAEPPATWDQFKECVRKLTVDTDGDGVTDQWGLNLWTRPRRISPHWNLWLSLVLQKNGLLMENGRFTTKHPALREAYDFIYEMEHVDKVLKTNHRFLDAVLADSNESFAIHYVNFYQMRFLRGKTEYQIMDRPQFELGGGQRYAGDERSSLVILKSTPEKEAASWKLVKWLTRKDVTPPTGRNFGDLRFFFKQSSVNRPDLKSIYSGFGDAAYRSQAAMSYQTEYREPILHIGEAMELCERIVDGMFRAEYSFEEAMSRIEVECNQILQDAESGGRPYALYLD